MKATLAVALTAALSLVPATANAQDQKVDGVRAAVKHGTLEIKGGDRSNTVALRLAAADPGVIEVDVGADGDADFAFARNSVAAIDVRMGDGDDVVRVDDANGPFTNAIPTTIAGGDGDDSLRGGAGNERYRGGDGDDTVVGGRGADVDIEGDGDDTFVWDPGDGSDVIEGQGGTDTMVFNGAGGNETVDISASGRRVTFARQPANIVMDTNGVEVIDFNALGGQDNITVGDLSATDVTRTNLDLAAALGGTAPDAADDTVTVKGTDGDDQIAVTGNGSGADVTGLASAVSVTHAGTTDTLAVNTLAGNDNVAVAGVAGLLKLLVDGVPS
jgi:hypothetical protein